MIGIRTPLSRGMQELRDPCEGGRCCSSNGLPRHFLLHALEIFVVPLQEYSALLEAPPSNRHELHSEAFVPPIRLRSLKAYLAKKRLAQYKKATKNVMAKTRP